MTKRAALVALVLFAALPLHAGFKDVVHAVESRTQMHPTYVPLLGLARFAVWIIHPDGVYDFQLATFEGADELDPRELAAIMRERAGAGYQPLVQVRSARSGEWSFIYAKPSRNGSRVDLLILTHDNDDTVLVRVDVDADVLVREMGEPKHVTRIASN
jgi:hypothetical protein